MVGQRPAHRQDRPDRPTAGRRFAPVIATLAAAGLVLSAIQAANAGTTTLAAGAYPVVGTAQDRCYDETGDAIACPAAGASLSGQDAQHPGRRPAYRDNGDGTVADQVTGLIWAKAPGPPMTYAELEGFARASRLGGHDDWRVPTIRELFSLIDYRGGYTGDPRTSRPYIDAAVFDFAYAAGSGLGDAAHGRRPIDVQEWSATWRGEGGSAGVRVASLCSFRPKAYASRPGWD